MPAPPEIIDALESVIDIYFSGVCHRERAAFILCDNLVETTCKAKAKQHYYEFDTSCGFYDAWNAPGVQLPRTTLSKRVQEYREVRNNMQHSSAAATVDGPYCASAILTSIEIIDRLWRNTSAQRLPSWMQVALRDLRLYSAEGNARQRVEFEITMQNRNWCGNGKTHVLVSGTTIQLGQRDNWGTAIRAQPHIVEECLNEIGVP